MTIPVYASQPFPAQIFYSGAGFTVPESYFMMSAHGVPYDIFADGSFAATISTSTDFISGLNSTHIIRCDWAELYYTGTAPSIDGVPIASGERFFITNIVGSTFQVSRTPTVMSATGVRTFGPTCNFTAAGSSVTMVAGGDAPAINLGFKGVFRTHDSGIGGMRHIHTASGVFDFSRPDKYIPYWYARGARTMFTINDTPPWNQLNTGAGNSGGNSPPIDPLEVGNFVTAMVNRYNKVSAINPLGLKMLWGFEGGNEPGYHDTTGTSGFWQGTAAQQAAQQKAVYQAAKAADSTVIVISPGFTAGYSWSGQGVGVTSGPTGSGVGCMYEFFNASDGASGKGKDWCDGVAYHGYTPGAPATWSAQNIDRSMHYQQFLDQQFQNCGIAQGFPRYQTERTYFPGQPGSTYLRQIIAEMPFLASNNLYTYDDPNFYWLRTDPQTVLLLNKLVQLAQFPITYVARNANGSVTCSNNQGQTFTV